jgi:ribosomal protein S19
MCRSKWKGFFFEKSLFKNRSVKNLKIWNRNVTIPGFLIGKFVNIHNGKNFKKVFISREKVGFKFGSFALSRKTLKIKKSKTTFLTKK